MEGTRRRPVPRLRPRLLRSRSYGADHSLVFTGCALLMENLVGPRGRHSCSTATKLRVIEYTRLRCPDGGVVGNRGATAGPGLALCPKRIRERVQTEEKIRQDNRGGGGKAK